MTHDNHQLKPIENISLANKQQQKENLHGKQIIKVKSLEVFILCVYPTNKIKDNVKSILSQVETS